MPGPPFGFLHPIEAPTVYTGVTLNLSTIDGAAFIAGCSQNLAGAVGKLVEISDGSKSARAWGKATGPGETLGSELVTNGTMEAGNPPTGWSAGGGATLLRSTDPHGGSYALKVSKASGGGSADQIIDASTGMLLKASAWAKGTDSSVYQGDLELALGDAGAYASNGVIYYSFPYGSLDVTVSCRPEPTGAGDFYFDDITIKQVTAPANAAANYGLTLVTTQGGTTYNFLSIESGFNPNAATFTVTVHN